MAPTQLPEHFARLLVEESAEADFGLLVVDVAGKLHRVELNPRSYNRAVAEQSSLEQISQLMQSGGIPIAVGKLPVGSTSVLLRPLQDFIGDEKILRRLRDYAETLAHFP